MEIEDNNCQCIGIAVSERVTIIREQKAWPEQYAMHEDQYSSMTEGLYNSETVDKNYEIQDQQFCLKHQLYGPKMTSERIMKSVYNLKVAWHSGRGQDAGGNIEEFLLPR